MILDILRSWRWLSKTQWLSRDELMSIQADKLRKIVRHAFNKTAFYRKLYGPSPPEIQTTRDIKRLPIISKEHLRSVPLEERTAAGTDLNKCIKKTTSGTSGMPVTVLEDRISAAYLEGLYLRRLWAYGVRPWHRIFRIVSGPVERAYTQNIADLAGIWGKIRTSRVVRLSAAEDNRYHLNVFATGIDVLIAPPSYFRSLREVCEEQDVNLPIKIAVSWGEILDHNTRKMIANFFGAEVFDGYGCTEVAPIGGLAWECPSHYAYHINVDSVVLEFLRDGEDVAAGEQGEVVATSLFRWATPVIRYRLGDLATPLDDECPCGRGLPLLKNIEGRVVDSIRIPGGGYISPYAVMESIQDIAGLIQFKVLQHRDYRVEVLVKVEGDVEKVVAEVEKRCRMLFKGLTSSIRVVDRIVAERGSKFKAVESKVMS